MRRVFNLVANGLKYLAFKSGRTYNEINILLYYGCIPLSWMILIDYGFGFHYLKMVFALFAIGFTVGCRDFSAYSDELFNSSVRFLNYFNRVGSNYINSSVWICVVFPFLIYGGILYWLC